MIEQGTEEWHAQRLGKFTASRMKDLMARAKKDGSFLKAAQDYMDEVLSERLTGKASPKPVTYAMQRGTDLEPEARNNYAFEVGVQISQPEFVGHPDFESVGASPDGYIGEDGLLEIKCPESLTKHLTYLKDKAHVKEYWWQVQCQLWVTGRKWCDLVSYHPDFPHALQLAIARIEPDAKAFEAMKEAVMQADAQISEALKSIQELQAAA